MGLSVSCYLESFLAEGCFKGTEAFDLRTLSKLALAALSSDVWLLGDPCERLLI